MYVFEFHELCDEQSEELVAVLVGGLNEEDLVDDFLQLVLGNELQGFDVVLQLFLADGEGLVSGEDEGGELDGFDVERDHVAVVGRLVAGVVLEELGEEED